MTRFTDQLAGLIIGPALGFYGYVIFTGPENYGYVVWNVLSQMTETWFPIAFILGFILISKVNFLVVTILVSLGNEAYLHWPITDFPEFMIGLTMVEGKTLEFPAALASEFAWKFYALLIAFSFADTLRMANQHIKNAKS